VNYQFLDLKNIPYLGKEYALCLGTFDGVHVGHRSLINKGKELGLKVAVLVVAPLPNLENKSYLNSLNDQKEIFSSLGVDYVLIAHLDDELRTLSPNDFINNIIKKLNPSAVIVGEDFRFGFKAAGDATLLKSTLTNDIDVYIMKTVMALENEKVSSTLIKKLLKEAEIAEVNAYLGRNYFIRGMVIKGRGLGKKLGFPTANLKLNFSYVLPKSGVYYVKIYVDEKPYFGLLNIGTNPTVSNENNIKIEVFIFNYDGDLYGKCLKIEFKEFVRDERKFNNIDELKEELENNFNTYKDKGE
jgi:riboflavin kinase/FMN adenylyltransferase